MPCEPVLGGSVGPRGPTRRLSGKSGINEPFGPFRAIRTKYSNYAAKPEIVGLGRPRGLMVLLTVLEHR